MSKVICGLSVSVDGFITGRDPRPGHGLGDGGVLFDWYGSGDVPSAVFAGFRFSAPSARVFDALASRVGASLAGRTTYADSDDFVGGAPHPTAPLVVLSHEAFAPANERQTIVSTGLADAVAEARRLADGKDVGLMGGVLVTEALEAGLVDELILHQVPVLLGAGRRFFHELPRHIALRIHEVVPAPDVTHLHFLVEHAGRADEGGAR
ncbi:dihydrofolate reductase family protein [Microbacterium azadirachtae]|uniref:dihydrofolate reductase family protein n=1 Tax=Microbacterium azadirachtae TaxID=582680 RepID=UPI00089015CD|nr:dihydrofolate reductase family protein [Microbacterium azadirachtae]SDL95429.1 Dihydrofolate reductase [Microbacterium azadirachtae]SEG12706.1 Dihydrofolate reductase [Microbacterium azadirachtae]SEG15299.1 Dihydrofolate reductase [Microbacterium azadirachtae]